MTHHYWIRVIFALLAVAGLSCQAAAQNILEPRRIAFVIGNSAYQSLTKLPNPANDSGAIAAGFRAAGYEVVGPLIDRDRQAMLAAIEEFERKASEADVAVIYYAGHGVEFGGENYLLPVDIKVNRQRDVERKGIKLSRLVAAASKSRGLKVVILDACRDNPLAKVTRSSGKGLANIEPSAGVLVAFSARHGTTALDGAAGGNSPFTTALLAQLGRPGTDVIDVFTEVSKQVQSATKGAQESYTYGAIDVARERRAALVAWRPEQTARPRPLFPESSQREVRPEELASLSCGELFLARNEIFARAGYCFATERGRINFDNNRGCTTTFQNPSQMELANARAIQLLEQQRCGR